MNDSKMSDPYFADREDRSGFTFVNPGDVLIQGPVIQGEHGKYFMTIEKVEASPDNAFDSGAVRSKDANTTRYDLLPPIGLAAVAATCSEGAQKYGDLNVELGMPVHDLLNHTLRHINMFLAGDRSEPHLPHAAWGILQAIQSDVLYPELNAPFLRGPGCTLTDSIRARLTGQKTEKAAKRKAGAFDHLGRWAVDRLTDVITLIEQRRGAQ